MFDSFPLHLEDPETYERQAITSAALTQLDAGRVPHISSKSLGTLQAILASSRSLECLSLENYENQMLRHWYGVLA